MTNRCRHEYSAIVFLDGKSVVAQDDAGSRIAAGQAGKDDADVVQAALDATGLGGAVVIRRGKYRFDKPVVVRNSNTLRGEGRATVVVPPQDDFAFKVVTDEQTRSYRPFQPGGKLYGVIFANLAIDGDGKDNQPRGKGIYLSGFWSSSFENLWIEKTRTAMYLHRVHESNFTNLYLLGNGDAERREACLVMAGANDNLHFTGLYVIYSNYIGLEMFAEQGGGAPRLVFISHSMFHGWLPPDKVWGPAPWPHAAPFDTIQLRDILPVGRTDTVISDSRITVAGPGVASVHAINSPVTIRDSVITATSGKYVVRATKGARVRLEGNTFHSQMPTGSEYAVSAEDAEVLMRDNVLVGRNLQVRLAPGRNSIIADNRFDVDSPKGPVLIGDDGQTGSRNVQVRGNVFSQADAASAVEVSGLSASNNIDVRDNFFGA